MGRRQTLLLLLVLSVFASFVSASSVEFLDEWGDATSHVLNESRVLLRVIDPTADTTAGRDSVSVSLSSVNGEDEATARLTESGGATGVFEGEAVLTTDFILDNVSGVDADQLYTSLGYPPAPDTATAAYGAATDSVEVGPSVTQIVDADGRGTATVTLGGAVRIRVQDFEADLSAGPDLTTATVTTSGGDSQAVTLTETGARTHVFEGSVPLAAGTPVAGDGRIQAAPAETLTATHADDAGSSSDTAQVVAAAVSFVRPRDGSATRLLLADSAIAMRVADSSRNLDPAAVESLGVSVSLELGEDYEFRWLRETGPDTGVFEGSIQHVTGGYQQSGNDLLDSVAVLPQLDTVKVQHEGFPYYAEAVAPLTGSILRLVDEAGADAASFALGSDLRVELETAREGSSFVDIKAVTVRSLTTGDVETLWAVETDGRSYLFQGSIPLVAGTAAVAGDGRLQAQAGENVEAEHAGTYGVNGSSDQAAVVRSAVRFVDGDGLPASLLLEESTARVRLLDALAPPQAPPPVTLRSRACGDYETLALSELPASPGLFEGSIFATRQTWDSGVLTVCRGYNEPEMVFAGDGQASASIFVVPAVLEILNGPVSPGDTLRLRAVAPRADTTPDPDLVAVAVSSRLAGDSVYMALAETGGATGIFEGTVGTLPAGGEPSYADLEVQPDDTVEAVYDAAEYAGDPTGRVVALADVVPLAVELLDGQGETAASYLIGDDLHIRVLDAAADTDPATVEAITATVTARRYGDDRFDVETVTLTETGPGTGVFTGLLPTAVIAGDPPLPEDGLLEFPNFLGAPDSFSTATAARGGASASAQVRFARIWLEDDLGRDAASFDVGATVRVWMRSPLDDATAAADTVTVGVEARTGTEYRDSLMLTLAETGGETGLFTATLPTAEPPVDFLDGVIQAVPGDVLFVHRTYNYTVYAFDTAVFTGAGEPPNRSPDAVDDAVATDEETPLVVDVRANDTDPDGDLLEVFQVGQPSHGTAVLNPDGTVTYTPPLNFSGSDLFLYAVRDGAEGTPYLSDTATVFITVHPVNDPPIAGNDSAATDEDTPVNVAVKANDGDPDGDPVAVAAANPGANGSVALEADGTVTYTPKPDFHGTDTFTYTLSDGTATAMGTVTVMVNPVNDPPAAAADSASTDEDTAVNFPVKDNDSDPDGDTLSVTAVTQGTKGSVVINQSPGALHWLIYTPDAGATGGDSFTYTVSDGRGGTAVGTVTMTITPVNDPPRAVADSVTTAEDTPLTFDPRANDTDPDGDPLTVTSASDPNRGSAVVNPDGTVTYTPEPDLSGTDGFVYSISDGQGGTWSALVTVTVTPVNDVPDARNDLPSTQEDTAATIDVLANDVDIDGDTLTVTIQTQPTRGTAVLNPDRTVTYTPEPDFTGSDSFTYAVADGNGGTDTATVSLSVLPVNDPPVAAADAASVAEDGTVTIPVAANDTDPENSALTLTAVTQGAHGTVTILTGNQVRYQPAANYFGPDTFTYTIRDPGSLTSTGTVSVTVTPVNDPPAAAADSAATNEDTPAAVSVLANDSDVDGGALSVTAVTQGANGSVSTNGTTVTYTPAPDWSGADAFTYTASDGNGGTATAAVTVSVAAVNDPPAAAADSGATREGVAVILPVLANDTDPEGNALAVTAVGSPANGSAVALADGTVQYTPGANFTGTDTFGYTVGDGQGGTGAGQVTVAVGEALERVAVLATNSAVLRSGSDVLSGDVIVNQAGAGPFLSGAELAVEGSVTTAANWDVEADTLTIAAGAVVGGDVSSNQLTNNGTIGGLQRSPLALPVFPALPAFPAASPGGSSVNVGNSGTRTLAPGSYLDLVVGRKGAVTFTGGVYHFRTITVDREAKLLFQAASEVRVQQKLATKNLTTVGPAAGASIDASAIVFYVGGINGTTGALAATPKAVEIGTSNTVAANLYAPNGTVWLQDGTTATGAFLGRDIDVGLNVQVTLDSAFSGGQ